ncbi:hypothetical protein CEXT_546341 [Caerostris extrusa]|uniref:Uncharacterized protein n=1 Tax=Caerostris extrusa TaxID=172846 RepID=A0AAV4YDC1_CAEEX|nr:hypothetical protein CEXT_546341 [Caerostris extrusa]
MGIGIDLAFKYIPALVAMDCLRLDSRPAAYALSAPNATFQDEDLRIGRIQVGVGSPEMMGFPIPPSRSICLPAYHGNNSGSVVRDQWEMMNTNRPSASLSIIISPPEQRKGQSRFLRKYYDLLTVVREVPLLFLNNASANDIEALTPESDQVEKNVPPPTQTIPQHSALAGPKL